MDRILFAFTTVVLALLFSFSQQGNTGEEIVQCYSFFFLSVIVFTTPNTYTGYSTNITLTFTLTIYLLTTLLIHALLYNTILKKTLKKCSQSHGLVNSVSVLLSWEAQETN